MLFFLFFFFFERVVLELKRLFCSAQGVAVYRDFGTAILQGTVVLITIDGAKFQSRARYVGHILYLWVELPGLSSFYVPIAVLNLGSFGELPFFHTPHWHRVFTCSCLIVLVDQIQLSCFSVVCRLKTPHVSYTVQLRRLQRLRGLQRLVGGNLWASNSICMSVGVLWG